MQLLLEASSLFPHCYLPFHLAKVLFSAVSLGSCPRLRKPRPLSPGQSGMWPGCSLILKTWSSADMLSRHAGEPNFSLAGSLFTPSFASQHDLLQHSASILRPTWPLTGLESRAGMSQDPRQECPGTEAMSKERCTYSLRAVLGPAGTTVAEAKGSYWSGHWFTGFRLPSKWTFRSNPSPLLPDFSPPSSAM